MPADPDAAAARDAAAGSSRPGAEKTPRELLLANLDLLHDLVGFVGRRYRLAAPEVEELESFVRLRLLENDFQILRAFQGRSELATYLMVVVQRLFLDFRNQTWGKWRVSAAAQRGGHVAQALEELICRDGYTFEEACQVLIVSRKVATTEAELRALWESMPLRYNRAPLDREPEAREDEPDPAPSPERLAMERQEAARVADVLSSALRRLPMSDRVLLRLRFAQGLTVAAASEVLHEPPKALYKRCKELAKELRRELRRAGVGAADVADLLADRGNLGVWEDLVAVATAPQHGDRLPEALDERES